MKHLRDTPYEDAIDRLVEEIKMKKNFEARLPKIDPQTGSLTVSVVNEKAITEDRYFRNYSDDWLPSWIELKTKLISVYK